MRSIFQLAYAGAYSLLLVTHMQAMKGGRPASRINHHVECACYALLCVVAVGEPLAELEA